MPITVEQDKIILSPTYDISQSYEANYQNGPSIAAFPPPRKIKRKFPFIGFTVNSLLGIPAGPLLNAKWISAYAQLGFDLPVYKTVRTIAAPSHPAPNCLFLDVKGQLGESDFIRQLTAATNPPVSLDEISITNSFGMPSRDVKTWQDDIAVAKSALSAGQILIVSVVGTPGQRDLSDDYAMCARFAAEAGADVVEINLSCPNVVSGEGSVYSDPDLSSHITKTVKQAIGHTPLIIKIGYIAHHACFKKVIEANAPYVSAISGINTLSFEVISRLGGSALPGRLKSGVCGSAIRQCAMAQAARIVELKKEGRYDFSIIGVGGIMTVDHIRQFFDLGVDAVMSATGAMWNPQLAYQYWKEMLVSS